MNSSSSVSHDSNTSTHSNRNKISSYLPVALVEDLSISDSLSSEELDVNENLPKINPKQQHQFKRRRSSSHDFLKSMHLINMFSNKTNEMIPQNLINTISTYNNNVNSSQQISNEIPSHTTYTSNIRNTFNKQQKIKKVVTFKEHSTPLSHNNNNNIHPPSISSHSSTSITTFPYMISSTSKELRSHTSKSAPREFIDPDLLNPNQTFQEFLIQSSHKLHNIIKTSIGSRFLQKMLPKITSKDITHLFHILNSSLPSLICDNYGNYFFQKIILKCSLEQRLFLYNTLHLHYSHIANDISGTHCLQSLIEKLSDSKEEEIIKNNIISNLYTLSCGVNSTHVIQKLIGKISEMKRMYINDFILENFVLLCKDVNGICVVKKFILENVTESIGKRIVNVLEKNCYEITRDQYGNYVMQQALEKYRYENVEGIVKIICEDVVCFSNQKFSSNVVDKVMVVLWKGNIMEFKKVVKEVFMDGEKVFEIGKNKFGMFVLMNVSKMVCEEDKGVIRKYLVQQLNGTNDEKQVIYGKILKNFL